MTTRAPKDRSKTLKNQVVVVEARWRDVFGAFFLDGLVVWAVAGAVVAAVMSSTGEIGSALVAGLVAWPAGSFVYGLTTAYRRSLGQMAAGTRTVRIADGSVPGFWRAGFVMLNRMVGMPLVSVITLLAALGGDSMFEDASAHLSIDVRATEALRHAAYGAPQQPWAGQHLSA